MGSRNSEIQTTMEFEITDDKVIVKGTISPFANIEKNGPSVQHIKPDGSGGTITAVSQPAFKSHIDGMTYETFVWRSNFRNVTSETTFRLWSGNGAKGDILIEKNQLITFE